MKTQVSVWGSRITMILISLGVFHPFFPAASHPLLNPFQNRTASHQGLLLEPVAGFFSTSENFDEDSARVPLSNGVSNTRILFDVNASFGFTDHFFLFGRLSLQSARVSLLDQAGSSSFGLSDQLVGLAYRVWNSDSGMSLNLQGEVALPAYNNSNAKNSGDAYLGDGSTDVTGGAFLEIPLNSTREVYLEAGGAYTFRSKGFSSAIPYSLKLKRDPIVRGFVFEGGVVGQVSLKTDIATDDPAARSVLNQDRIAGSGGSFLINALNPAFVQIMAKVGYKNQKGQILYAGVSTPFYGTNSATGFAVSLGATLDFGQKSESPVYEREETGTDRTESPRTESPRAKPPSRPKKPAFISYDLDAQILSTNDQLYLIRVDKGSTDGVEAGQVFDIYADSERVARARVSSVKDEEAILNVVEYFQVRSIETSFLARRLSR